ncbi:MAG: hypothetical protein RI907_3185 [Pseudomonadota bacterium]|jgi:putative SOS response-associated peptidase YedK
MCNLYSMPPKNALGTYLAKLGVSGALPDYDDTKPVGPFGSGLFIRPDSHAAKGLTATLGQWGLIRPGQRQRVDLVAGRAQAGRKPPAPRPRSTNNARVEGISTKPTFATAWRSGQRCLVPAQWYAEPNWETGRCVWWHQRRADHQPWFIAGLWSEWTDPHSGEIVPNFTMITCNCDGHPLLNRLHKPDPTLPPDQQDKRSLVHIDDVHWAQWLHGSEDEALALIHPPALNLFDASDAHQTDRLLAANSPAAAQETGPSQAGQQAGLF